MPEPATKKRMSLGAKTAVGAAVLVGLCVPTLGVIGVVGAIAGSEDTATVTATSGDAPVVPQSVADCAEGEVWLSTIRTCSPTPTAAAPIASAVPTPTAAAAPTKAPKQPKYQKLSAREWSLIARDPSAHTGRRIIVHGVVFQADAATGTNVVMAHVDGKKRLPEYGYVDYDDDAMLVDGGAGFSQLVEDDLFTAHVIVEGAETYDTAIGGSNTVPRLTVTSLKVTGEQG